MQKSAFIAVFLVLAAVLFAVGCTQSGSSTPAATQTPAPTTVATTAPTPATIVPTTVQTSVITVTSTPTWGTIKPTPTVTTTETTVYMRNMSFTPTPLHVLPGTMITWRNEDDVTHAVQSSGIHAGLFQSGNLIKGQEFSFTFGDVGTYDYICTLHPTMTGTIIVENGADIVGVPQYN